MQPKTIMRNNMRTLKIGLSLCLIKIKNRHNKIINQQLNKYNLKHRKNKQNTNRNNIKNQQNNN